jgi:uncharacterized protein (DUF58 family)
MKSLQTFIRIVKTVKSRPNRYFALLIITIIGLFFLAYMHNYNIVYLVMFFTFAFAAASSLTGRFNLDALDARILSCERLFAAVPSPCRLLLHNHSSRISYALVCLYAGQSRNIQRIDPHQSEMIAFDVRFDRRGEIDFPALEVGSYFPLPYERFYTFRSFHKKAVVYPEPRGISLQDYYIESKVPIGERDDFEGLRPYRQDDNAALIHWPSLAVGAGVMSKQFSYTRQNSTLRFDFSSCADSDEARLSQLCLWILACEKEHIPFSIAMPARVLESKKMTTDAILAYLAGY